MNASLLRGAIEFTSLEFKKCDGYQNMKEGGSGGRKGEKGKKMCLRLGFDGF